MADIAALRSTVRSLARARQFTLSVILVLGCGSAMASVVTAVVDAVLVRPLPFAHPERLVAIWSSSRARGLDKVRVMGPDYERWRNAASAFDRMTLFGSWSGSLTGRGDAAQIDGARVSPEFFALLGIHPSRGRFFTAADYRRQNGDTVVISDALARRRFGAGADPIGESLTLDGERRTVIGVAPRQILPARAAPSGRLALVRDEEFIWLPLPSTPQHHGHTLGVLARLAPGVTLEQASEQMGQIARRIAAEDHLPPGEGEVRVVPLHSEVVAGAQQALILLSVAIALVLVATTANVGGLMLVRVAARRRELAVRRVLGASSWQLFMRFLTEAVVLAGVGALTGLAAAVWLLRLLPALLPATVSRFDEARIDSRVVAVVAAAALLSALCVAGLPSLAARRAESLEATLRAAGRGLTSRGRSGLAPLLITLEVAMAAILAVGSALLFTSLERLRGVDPGFEAGSVLLVDLVQQPARYPERMDLERFYHQLFDDLRRLPEVRAVAASYDRPLSSSWYQSFELLGDAARRVDADQGAVFRTVTPEYFAALGVSIVAGRGLRAEDDARHAGAVVVNEAFARRFLPDRALGRQLDVETTQWIWHDQIPTRFEVVGVVEDEKFGELSAAAEPAFYLPYRQTPHHEMTVLVRTTGNPLRLLPQVRSVVRHLDPDLPIAGSATLQEVLAGAVARPRFDALALGSFSTVALVLALAGLSAFLANVLRQRRHDVAVRIALGAGGRDVAAHFLGQALRPALLGVALGLGSAALLSRLLAGLLFGVSALDPRIYAATAAGLVLVALGAAAVPALRAARIRPAVVLRGD